LLAAAGPPGGVSSGAAGSGAGGSQALSPPASPAIGSGGHGPAASPQHGHGLGPGGHHPPHGRRVLVCAQSNAAVDEVAARLAGLVGPGAWGRDGRHVAIAGLVRVGGGGGGGWDGAGRAGGNGAAAAVGLEAFSLDAVAARLAGDLAAASAPGRGGGGAVARRKAARAARMAALAAAPVVAATLSAAGGELADLMQESAAGRSAFAAPAASSTPHLPPFDAVIIDEAAAALESAALVPLRLLAPHAPVILVGDPAQLPATVLARGAAVRSLLGRSLFERLAAAGVPARLLDAQYRMHPAIASFPSTHFYDGAVRNGAGGWWEGEEGEGDGPAAGPPRLAFFDIARGAEAAPGGASLANSLEADAAAALAVRLADGASGLLPPGASIAVITPYKAQAVTVRARLARARLPAGADIAVFTVDGVQGREFDGVVFSCVRACPPPREAAGGTDAAGPAAASAAASSLRFLSDVRRANVALTRSRRRLFVVGRAATLEGCPPYAAFMEAARAGGGFHADVRDVGSALARLTAGQERRQEREETRRQRGRDEVGERDGAARRRRRR
jgi:senataxin